MFRSCLQENPREVRLCPARVTVTEFTSQVPQYHLPGTWNVQSWLQNFKIVFPLPGQLRDASQEAGTIWPDQGVAVLIKQHVFA